MSLVNKVKININGYFSEMGTSEDIPEDILDIIEENDGNIGLVSIPLLFKILANLIASILVLNFSFTKKIEVIQ